MEFIGDSEDYRAPLEWPLGLPMDDDDGDGGVAIPGNAPGQAVNRPVLGSPFEVPSGRSVPSPASVSFGQPVPSPFEQPSGQSISGPISIPSSPGLVPLGRPDSISVPASSEQPAQTSPAASNPPPAATNPDNLDPNQDLLQKWIEDVLDDDLDSISALSGVNKPPTALGRQDQPVASSARASETPSSEQPTPNVYPATPFHYPEQRLPRPGGSGEIAPGNSARGTGPTPLSSHGNELNPVSRQTKNVNRELSEARRRYLPITPEQSTSDRRPKRRDRLVQTSPVNPGSRTRPKPKPVEYQTFPVGSGNGIRPRPVNTYDRAVQTSLVNSGNGNVNGSKPKPVNTCDRAVQTWIVTLGNGTRPKPIASRAVESPGIQAKVQELHQKEAELAKKEKDLRKLEADLDNRVCNIATLQIALDECRISFALYREEVRKGIVAVEEKL